MKEITAFIVVIVGLITIIFGIPTLLIYTIQKHEDNYCINAPLDRMDKKRCGLQP